MKKKSGMNVAEPRKNNITTSSSIGSPEMAAFPTNSSIGNFKKEKDVYFDPLKSMQIS